MDQPQAKAEAREAAEVAVVAMKRIEVAEAEAEEGEVEEEARDLKPAESMPMVTQLDWIKTVNQLPVPQEWTAETASSEVEAVQAVVARTDSGEKGVLLMVAMIEDQEQEEEEGPKKRKMELESSIPEKRLNTREKTLTERLTHQLKRAKPQLKNQKKKAKRK